MNEIVDELFAAQDLKYRDFQIKLVPGLSEDKMIGVRTQSLRTIAKNISKNTSHTKDFLKEIPHTYFEENLIHFFVIAGIKDFNECIAEVEKFLPHVDCWPVCDQASPKVFKKNHQELLPHIKKWISSEHTYTSRYGMRMLMNEFLDADFTQEYPKMIVSRMKQNGADEDYYLKMMAAWYFATALAKQWNDAIPYLEKKCLEPWTHNKAIQKALESFRVSDEHKQYLRTLKIN
ncbi:MAG: DNA alkylation repair protein [Treponema sp.]|nr:DNA alkylation repair protein [Treponema sp.]